MDGREPDSRTRGPARLFSAYVALAERRTGWLLALFALLFLVALAFALTLQLHSDVAELLPSRHPAVVALERIAGRQKSASNLVVLVHSTDPGANRRFAEALRPQLDRLIPRTFSQIEWRPDREVADFAHRWKWLYASVRDLDHVEELVDRLIARHAQPAFVDLEDDPEEELRHERERMNRALPVLAGGGQPDYFEKQISGQEYLGIRLWRRFDGLGSRGEHATLDAVKQAVARTDPRRFGALTVEYTGGIAQSIDEQNAIRNDLTIATLACATLVLLAIYSYFGRVALLWVIGAPALLGLVLALFLAALTLHSLNLNTAFLISIILGNGINSPIVLLARYGEERRSGQAVGAALARAMTLSLPGVGAAVAAASVAYACLAGTSFRGFNQFGLLGGAGMLLVGVATFALVPPLVVLGERHWPGRLTPRPPLWRAPFSRLGALCRRRPRWVALAALGATLAAVWPLCRWAADPLEWSFSNLRSDDTPSQRLWPHMEALGMGDVSAGRVGNNAVMLVDDPAQADPVAEALKAADRARGAKHVLKDVRTLHSMLPDHPEEKLATLARLRRKIDRHVTLLDAAERRDLHEWRPPDELRPLTLADLPHQVLDAFTEVDGQRGRLIGIDADHQTYSDWNGHDLIRMSAALSVDALGKRWVAASPATIFAGMLETIVKDGPRVTLAALAGVTLLMLVIFSGRGAWPVLCSLFAGVVWLGALCGVFNLKLNFMNYVALPITLGVGADYAANMWARLRTDGDRLPAALAETGSAVALSSLTTVIGYSSLLFSHNRALRSFGLVADLGELTCLSAALLVLPSMVRLFGWHRRRLRPAAEGNT